MPNMRQRVAFTAAAVAFIILVLTRHHLRDLSEMGQTYATFYPYLSRHPDTLYRYPSSEEKFKNFPEPVVPRIIHQIYLTGGPPANLTQYDGEIASCRALHPDWTHNIWLDENSIEFMWQHYPHLVPTYQGYKQRVQKSDLLRYALLEHFGGVYFDLDVTCLKSLDELRHVPFLSPGAHPAGVNNAFILSRPGHPFWASVLAAVKSKDLYWGLPYVENMFSIGCMFFSNRWISYTRLLARLAGNVRDEDRVYILADEDGNLAPHMLRGVVTTPLFHHGGASSWHGWDAATILFVGKHYHAVVAGAVVLALVVFAVTWRIVGASRRGSYSRLRADQTPPRKDFSV